MIRNCNQINSDYIVCASIKDASLVKTSLINPLVRNFFGERDINEYEELSIENSFADIDFPNISFDKIYSNLLSGVQKIDFSVKIPVKFLITVDKQNCSQKCKKTDIFFDVIEINEQPFLYFLYMDLSLILSTLRNSKIQPTL